MLKLAKIVEKETGKVDVALGTDEKYYTKLGFTKLNVEQGTDGQWYLSKKISPELKPKEQRKSDELLKELKQLESETGYTRLIRDVYFNIKKMGGTTNQIVYKKMLEIDEKAKQYRKLLKKEKQNDN